ncbi:MAG: hypothetical protein NVSMB18_35820 [Acetobacteraceae bacterium]
MFKRRKPDEITGAPPPASPAQADKLEVGMPSPDPFKPPAPVADSGVGMPPLRPVQKEAPPMGRTPYPAPTPPATPMPTPVSGPITGLRPGMPPNRTREPAERRTLVVGRGISVQGTVQDAERLVVEGTVEASMIHATELSIAQGGVFKGTVEVEEAEIAGTIDGTLTARGNLIVRATGRVLGTAHYRRLQVEDGGQITGELKMITEPAGARPDANRPLAADITPA